MPGVSEWGWARITAEAVCLSSVQKIRPPHKRLSMIDTHCHFDFSPFRDAPERYWQAARESGVMRMVVPGVSESNWSAVLSLTERLQGVYAGLGLHPCFLDVHTDTSLDKLDQALAARPARCVAVGEAGLDFFVANQDAAQQRQQALLEGQLWLARHYDLPIILHSRKAHNQLLRTVKAYPGVRGVLHAFSGSEQQGKQFIDAGLMLGVGGTVTYSRAQKTRRAIAQLPLEHLVLETDAPDMPLAGFQGKPNTPSQVSRVADVVAALKSCDRDHLVAETSDNAERLFGFD
ncbi:TatD family deoxyribonuclease [Salinivibrio sp. VYel9]|nr:TatD family deoxyribonuclease [Salinivibrio sp. VYel7]MPX94932.1 TatD family deoxyribonuclease [Salinivibrio sp. VYel9]MPX97854.1 TatD family deoxyribonuclease [Salinivibrio sp. VYel6]MPY01162.1 TatD family deoxyribonuclease [Salinivibrio sp. VYel4]MPY04238.1 TatD family deoxyribonuclease [Salinivibrio sp. VYel5]MPY07193.1 TatD family deoxyribonuclease [Salinivibrio sp. VYel8]MPY15167.1 TatD family deoxyribonuclease [Salinivibrio sp. VGrn1]